MPRDGGHNWLRHAIGDFALAMALFWGAALYVIGDHNRAHAVAAPRIGKETILDAAAPASAGWHAGMPRGPRPGSKADAGGWQPLALLSVAFAAIVALNLGFLRHLRRAYASPRRSVWRRGRQRMGG